MIPDIEMESAVTAGSIFLREMPNFSRSARGGSIKAPSPWMLAETTLRPLAIFERCVVPRVSRNDTRREALDALVRYRNCKFASAEISSPAKSLEIHFG
jgi:hypothetical protein